jgi:hypothetical protein
MTIENLAAVCAVISMISAGVAVYVSLSVRLAVAQLRAELADGRTKDSEARGKEREEMKNWINGSFMRAVVVETKFLEYDRRLKHVEERN